MNPVTRYLCALLALGAAGVPGTTLAQIPHSSAIPPSLRDVSMQRLDRLGVRGDFDRDGYADLAVGVPGQVVGGAARAGEVHVFFGSSTGLGDRDQVLDATLFGFTAEADDEFGASVAIGNFDGDLYSDLAIGVPGRSIGSLTGTGVVMVAYGSSLGLSTARAWMCNQNTGIIGDTCELGDHFGAALAVGDFDNDNRDDLLVGVPGENINTFSDAGAMHVIYGSATGLSDSGSAFYHQSIVGIEGDPDDDDEFGTALAAGDFDGDGYDDAAVGVPGDTATHAGAVNVIHGSSVGLDGSDSNRYYRGDTNGVDNGSSDGLYDTAESGDEFGSALAAGDFNGDGRDDLAIGAYGMALCPDCGTGGGGLPAALDNAGAVIVLYGSSGGLQSSTSRSDQIWSQDSPGITDCEAEAADWFGYALSVGDFDDDGVDDLVIGVPGEEINSDSAAGMVHVIYGRRTTSSSTSGLDDDGQQRWHQDTVGSEDIDGTADTNDIMGWAAAVGDFNGDGIDDLAIGSPGETINATPDVPSAGAINVLYAIDLPDFGLDAYRNLWLHRDSSSGIMRSVQASAAFGYALAAAR